MRSWSKRHTEKSLSMRCCQKWLVWHRSQTSTRVQETCISVRSVLPCGLCSDYVRTTVVLFLIMTASQFAPLPSPSITPSVFHSILRGSSENLPPSHPPRNATIKLFHQSFSVHAKLLYHIVFWTRLLEVGCHCYGFRRMRVTEKLSTCVYYKKAQLSLTNPHDAKACQNCSNLTCL